jgi:RecA-family ATPase/5S rRNA maturation endonuclease (ribonuclease M5)
MTLHVSSAEILAKALGGHKSGAGWMARCPCHDDSTASLSINDGRSGAPVVRCHAGCSQADVIGALEARGLWERKPDGSDGQKKKQVAAYQYTNEEGQLIYEVIRYEPKAFSQRRPDGNGRWIWNTQGIRRVPYRLTELIEAIADERLIVIAEGEKDVDSLAAIGIPATCNAGGANKWSDELNEHFRGADVVIIPDKDEPGRKHAEDVAAKLQGIAQRVRVLELDVKDASKWLEAGGTSQALYALVETSARYWKPDTESMAPPDDEQPAPRLEQLPFLDMSAWDTEPTPEREWAVRDRIPIRQVALISGEGEVGKSIVELQLAAAHVLARDWLGSLPEPGPAIYLGCEDEADELRRRLAAICAHYRVRFSDLIGGGMHLLSYVEGDAMLGVLDRSGAIVPTKLYNQLLEAAGDIKPKHIGLDTSADIFGGNEIDRSQVRQFIAMLRKLARTANGSVVLLSHPSLAGINSGTGLSGSTAWHNSVRARIYMHRAEDASNDDLREIEFKKNQYGKRANRLLVRYQNGVFVPDGGKSTMQRTAEDAKVDQAFLHCLDVKTAQGVPVSSRPSRSGAAQVFAQMPEANGIKVKAFAEAQERLLSARKIEVKPYGPPSHDKTRVVRKNT